MVSVPRRSPATIDSGIPGAEVVVVVVVTGDCADEAAVTGE